MNSLTKINTIAKAIKSLTQKDFDEAATMANPQLINSLKAIKKTISKKSGKTVKA